MEAPGSLKSDRGPAAALNFPLLVTDWLWALWACGEALLCSDLVEGVRGVCGAFIVISGSQRRRADGCTHKHTGDFLPLRPIAS